LEECRGQRGQDGEDDCCVIAHKSVQNTNNSRTVTPTGREDLVLAVLAEKRYPFFALERWEADSNIHADGIPLHMGLLIRAGRNDMTNVSRFSDVGLRS
jgi:hypothetical protein